MCFKIGYSINQIYINIALPVPVNSLFTYSIDSSILDDSTETLIGRRVFVKFGKRQLTGVIIEKIEKPDLDKISPIIELLDTKPIFNLTMMDLLKWIADYYFAPIGETISAALPRGFSPKSILKIGLSDNYNEKMAKLLLKNSPKKSILLERIKDLESTISIQGLQEKTGLNNISAMLDALKMMNLINIDSIIENRGRHKTLKAVKLKFGISSQLKEILSELDKKSPKQAQVILHILSNNSDKKAFSYKEIMQKIGVSASVIDQLVKKELLELEELVINRSKQNHIEKLAEINEFQYKLTDEQNRAYSIISKFIGQNQFKTFLLHGVTGSGKTLVYIHAIKQVLEINKTALYLVPEILLTQQLIDRFELAFPNQIAVLHSKMSDGERFDSWMMIYQGKAKIVIGARSALFAPLNDIGIIIIDEEHESSYKQNAPAPRYNARDAAIVWGKLNKCPVVLGSATPSIESIQNSKLGRYELLEIRKRADNAKLPTIQVIDMINARKQGMIFGSFSEVLINEIKNRVEKKEGVILFQNRRGFSPIQECKNCGNIPMCQNCDITLTYHKSRNLLICHYCGYSHFASKTCEVCGSNELDTLGFGTQRLEEELHDILRTYNIDAKIDRIDLDSVSRKNSLRAKLINFQKGETDILIGTQMVAKGLDFERVTLVGVINADMQLLIPDFRSAERTFQLITQVAGRAGRSSTKAGEVIVQSSQPEHYAISNAVTGDYNAFVSKEIEYRKNSFYPPYSRFIYIEFTSKEEEKVNRAAENFAKLLPKYSKEFQVLGPTIPKVPRIKSQFRRIIIIKSSKVEDPSGSHLRHYIQYADQEYKKRFADSAVKYIIDVDSYSTL